MRLPLVQFSNRKQACIPMVKDTKEIRKLNQVNGSTTECHDQKASRAHNRTINPRKKTAFRIVSSNDKLPYSYYDHDSVDVKTVPRLST